MRDAVEWPWTAKNAYIYQDMNSHALYQMQKQCKLRIPNTGNSTTKKRAFPNMRQYIWLKGNKSVITLIMADHNCIQACILACSNCHLWLMLWFVMEQLFLKQNPVEKNFSVSSLKRWTDRGCCSLSSVQRCCCIFADQLWAMSDISTLRKDKKNANVQMFKQIEKIKSLGFFFHHCVNKGRHTSADCRGEIQRKIADDFLDAKFQNML